VAARTASTVPSPPSAMGTQTVCASGYACLMPRAMAAAASGAERLSLNESGAMTIFTIVEVGKISVDRGGALATKDVNNTRAGAEVCCIRVPPAIHRGVVP